MSAYLVSFHDAVRALIGAAWPETLTNGIYRDVELARFSDLQRKAAAGKLPFAVFNTRLVAQDWGLTNRAAEGPLTVLYVDDDGTTFDALTAKLETLRDQAFTSGISTAQVLSYPTIQDSLISPALNDFFASVQRPFIAGAVVIQVLAGETGP